MPSLGFGVKDLTRQIVTSIIIIDSALTKTTDLYQAPTTRIKMCERVARVSVRFDITYESGQVSSGLIQIIVKMRD